MNRRANVSEPTKVSISPSLKIVKISAGVAHSSAIS
jgi:hypothetical protein